MKTIALDRWTKPIALLAALMLVSGSIVYAQDQADATEPSEAEAAEETVEAIDPFAVPDGSVEELLSFIEGIERSQPEADTRAAAMQFYNDRSQAILGAAEKILAAGPTDEQFTLTVGPKIVALGILSQLGDAEAQEKLAELPDQLAKAGHVELSLDAKAHVLQSRLRATAAAGGEEFKELLAKVNEFVDTENPGRREAGVAMMAVRAVDMTGDEELAVDAYTRLGELLARSDDQLVASVGNQFQGSARRMTLLGNEMKVVGVTLDGKPFVWEDYKGKVVLVDFWATWCGPCLEELPNIRENYLRYHDLGFEVVGISLDDNRRRLMSFMEQSEIPWTVLFDGDAPEVPMADYYGVLSIPTMILVDRDGKVISTNSHGAALGHQLDKLLGPVPELEPAAKEPSGDDA